MQESVVGWMDGLGYRERLAMMSHLTKRRGPTGAENVTAVMIGKKRGRREGSGNLVLIGLALMQETLVVQDEQMKKALGFLPSAAAEQEGRKN